MKLTLFPLFLIGLTLTSLGLSRTQAQGLNIGIVDMQECLNQYYKTPIEVEGVNGIAKEKQGEIDSKRADYEALTKKAADLDAKVRDTSLSNEQRTAAATELQQIMQERLAKGREISEAERRAQQEIIDARQKMEARLVASIREVVDVQSKALSLDLVIDKSFLPKANKVILFTSDKVPDLTTPIIAELNKDAPPGFVPAAPGAAPAPAAGGTPGN